MCLLFLARKMLVSENQVAGILGGLKLKIINIIYVMLWQSSYPGYSILGAGMAHGYFSFVAPPHQF